MVGRRCTSSISLYIVIAKMNQALDDVRASEARTMAQEGYEPLLKKSRWCVLQSAKRISRRRRKIRLRDLLRYNLQTVRAYLCSKRISSTSGPTPDLRTWAGLFLDFWCHRAMRSRIEPMKKIALTLRAHRPLLLNYFKARKQFSSGVVEGLNNKAKVTMRRSYGFRTFRILELALYHSLGKLPGTGAGPRISST